MSVQSVQDNGSVKGTIDLADHVTVGANGKSATITIEEYLSAKSQYDASESPNERLAYVLQQANRLPVAAGITNFLNTQTGVWNKSYPAAVASSGESKLGRCSQGTTLVATSGPVTENFCIDNEATQKVKDKYPTWSEAKGFCEAAGKSLLTYEQHKLGAKSTDSSVVRNSGDWEWVLESNGDNSVGQVGGFFYVNFRLSDDEFLDYLGPDHRDDGVAFRCGGVPSPQD